MVNQTTTALPLVTLSVSVLPRSALVSSDILNISEADLVAASICEAWELLESGSEFSVMGEILCRVEPPLEPGFWTDNIAAQWFRTYYH